MCKYACFYLWRVDDLPVTAIPIDCVVWRLWNRQGRGMMEDMNAERACGVSTSLQPVASASQGPTGHPAVGPQEVHLKPSASQGMSSFAFSICICWKASGTSVCRLDTHSTSGTLASPLSSILRWIQDFGSLQHGSVTELLNMRLVGGF